MARARKSQERLAFDAEVGRRIALTRRALGMSARELARAASLRPATLCQYESGARGCELSILARLAGLLGVSVSVLVPKFRK